MLTHVVFPFSLFINRNNSQRRQCGSRGIWSTASPIVHRRSFRQAPGKESFIIRYVPVIMRRLQLLLARVFRAGCSADQGGHRRDSRSVFRDDLFWCASLKFLWSSSHLVCAFGRQTNSNFFFLIRIAKPIQPGFHHKYCSKCKYYLQ